jgi:hypothetical protein
LELSPPEGGKACKRFLMTQDRHAQVLQHWPPASAAIVAAQVSRLETLRLISMTKHTRAIIIFLRNVRQKIKFFLKFQSVSILAIKCCLNYAILLIFCRRKDIEMRRCAA